MAIAALRPLLSATLACAALALVAGCARMTQTRVDVPHANGFADVKRYLQSHPADFDAFRARGPFDVETRNDIEVAPTSSHRVAADLYLSTAAGRAPLVILVHGYDRSKADHGYQCLHLATWGLHCLAVQLPARGPWRANGATLARLLEGNRGLSAILPDDRIDAANITLVGYSFGAYAVAAALAQHADALGAILLDPAIPAKESRAALRTIDAPVMVIGADETAFTARGRDAYFRSMRNVSEVSVRGAGHEDAEFPLEPSAGASAGPRATFLAALTCAALSLAATGRFDDAWASFQRAVERGELVEPKRK